jgi:myo-inositol-1(or 4)-monophosphatase
MKSTTVEVATAAAKAGGEVLLANWRRLPQGSVTEKQRNDFVTFADRESENAIVAVIREAFPGDAFLAEEGGDHGSGASKEGRTWIIDPLDGTSNFIAGFPLWCVSIASSERGRLAAGIIWDPLRGELFAAERGSGAWKNGSRISVTDRQGLSGAFLGTGFPFRAHEEIDRYLSFFRAVFLEARAIRRGGSAALDLAYVAAGVFDGFFEFRLCPWDTAAGAVLIEEAGGKVSGMGGEPLSLERGDILAGTPGVFSDLVAVSRRVLGERAS